MLAAIVNTFSNCFKIPELKSRILFTLGGAGDLPAGGGRAHSGPGRRGAGGLSSPARPAAAGGVLLGMYSMFTGGALEHCAVGALGIMPYISATIIIQLLTAVVPTLSKLAREEGGRTKIIQYGRYLTVLLCLGQGVVMAIGWENPEKLFRSGIIGPAGALHRCSHLVVPHPDGADADDRHDAADVAGRTDHRARHRQRRFAGHHHRHSGAAAAGGDGAEGHVLPRRRRGSQVQLRARDRAGAAAGGRDRRRHCGHPGAAENPGAIRPAGGGPQSLFGRHLVHAVAGQLRGRHADHFCPGHPDVSAEDFPDSSGRAST